MSRDRRKARRWHLVNALYVFEQNSGEMVGQLLNVSVDGMMLATETPVEVDQRFYLWIEILTERVMIEAESRWCEPDGESDFYKSGYSFVNLTASTRKKVETLIEALKFYE